jgi:hypothetical protein
MVGVDEKRFTVGVFQDVTWAKKGLEALSQAGFPAESLTILAKASPEAASLVENALGVPGEQFDLAGMGAVIGRGSLILALQGERRDFPKLGLSGTMRRVGFQPHDGRIFDALTTRGGILVAVEGEPRAADALALLHSYGGGNAAIGAWTGRV